MLDILIKNGRIVDGSGEASWTGDIGVQDGRIVALDSTIMTEAKKVIDATGKIVSPGFIDIHSHSDLMVLDESFGEIKLRQGVTTELYGNCGFSAAPTSAQTLALLQDYSEPIMGKLDQEWAWKSYGEYVHLLKTKKHRYNIGGLVGNGALRIAAKGFEPGPLSDEEMETVKTLLDEALTSGALGLSFGLMYVPENYYSKQQLVEICQVVKAHNGLVTTHIRGEGNSLTASIREVIDIAKESGVSLHISHLKAAGKNNWNDKIYAAIQMIDEARAQGLDVTCDVYPYTAGSTTLTTLMPPWSLEGGITHTLERIKDSTMRQKIVHEMQNEATTWDNLVYTTGWENVLISSVDSQENAGYVGKNVAQIALEQDKDPTQCALDILLEENGNVSIVFFHMSEADVIHTMQLEYSFIISDSLFSAHGMPHPRSYGTFPRVFAKYVRESQALTLEQAVKKVTALPAARMHFNDRGQLKEGYVADITIFDLETIIDCATYIEPKQFPKGIDYVLVGGEIALEHGQVYDVKKGQVIVGNV